MRDIVRENNVYRWAAEYHHGTGGADEGLKYEKADPAPEKIKLGETSWHPGRSVCRRG